jgi:hypothetical protein
MECTIQWMRKTYSTLGIASRADARISVFVHAPYTYPLMLVAVDMAQKNSVIAEERKQTCTKGKLQDAADNRIT